MLHDDLYYVVILLLPLNCYTYRDPRFSSGRFPLSIDGANNISEEKLRYSEILLYVLCYS